MERRKTLQLTLNALFIALIVLLQFTPLGYFKIGPLEFSLLTLPVVLAAMLLGTWSGLLMGCVFGLTSFIQCFGASPFGAALLAVNPVYTFLVCVLPRALMGFLAGLLFQALTKRRTAPAFWTFAVTSLAAALMNTVFFMTTLLALFSRSDYLQSMINGQNLLVFAALFVGIQSLVEAGVCTILGTALGKGLWRALKL